MSTCTIALIILGVTIVLFVTELLPLPVTAVGAAIAMSVFGVIPFSSSFAGFSSDVTLMVIGSMIIGEALFSTGVAAEIGHAIIKMVGTNEKVFIIACVVISAVLSAFLSNTAVVAMMLPVAAATAASSKGAITKKNSFMAIGFAANVGGGLTLVGSTPNVIGQGLLADAGLETMGFFDLTLGGLPRLVVIILFYATIGCALQNKVFNFPEVTDETMLAQANSEGAQKHDPVKMAIASGILILTIIGFISGIWTVGIVAMIAGLLCIITRCISIKELFARIDWTTVWVLAGSLGFASGIAKSGAGQLIADTIIGWFGGSVSLYILMIMFTLLATLMGNFMSSSAAVAILGPIGISMCQTLNFSTKPLMMVIIWSLNLAFLTPIATPPVTMTLQGGYRFLDYTKIGSILLISCLVVSILTYPLVFHL
ncbi:MAG: anion permease [Intestinimonas sp.]|nr:anion permease [Intestinimonas sp.]